MTKNKICSLCLRDIDIKKIYSYSKKQKAYICNNCLELGARFNDIPDHETIEDKIVQFEKNNKNFNIYKDPNHRYKLIQTVDYRTLATYTKKGIKKFLEDSLK